MDVDPTIPIGDVPRTDTAAHLLICVGPRCVANGSAQLFSEIWDALESEQIAYYRTGGSVRLTDSGCLGACELGPTVACYYRGSETAQLTATWRVRMTFDSTLALARSVHRPSRDHPAMPSITFLREPVVE